MTQKQYVIIGNGIAGISAAQALRQHDSRGKIKLIGDESTPFYYRASLTEWITGELGDDALIARTPDFYEALKMDQISEKVIRVEPEEHCVYLTSGQPITYDALCLATGARSRRIPLEGIEEDAICTYRTLQDAQYLKNQLRADTRVLIIGGGVLGLELAGGLKRMDVKQVGLVQILDYVGGPVLDQETARWLEAKIEADGCRLFLKDSVDHIDGQTAIMKSGAAYPFDLLVEAVGVTPIFPEVPNLEAGRGVRIDAHGRTNLPDIYACGDCTETYSAAADRWFTTRIWYDCARQGRAAGAAMAGHENPYQKTVFFNCSLIYNALYSYIGDPHGEAGIVHRYETPKVRRKIRLVDGRLAGALLVGDRRGTTALFHAIGQDVSKFGKELAQPHFNWNALNGQDWDYRFY